ncbi:hypothetical protein RchiOBHm_Chr3g0462701 [Rosa chinensis]|uniref:Uncharacterized protein n=2 Tax=Rosa chinensis TaxID=74649 RepID=A0A2P6R908_ROSCH|nr:hypothetical protein RchiOBHm_Chr3g0462701 [Rosa chinensis]
MQKLRIKYKERLTELYVREERIRPEICIYRVPEKLRKLKEDAYNPRAVSIGPFHRGKSSLAPMEHHKLLYTASFLGSFIASSEATEKYMDSYMEHPIAPIHVDWPVNKCYNEEIKCEEGRDKLTELLQDGCFILQLFLSFAQLIKDSSDEYESDPLINNAWMIRDLWHDLALLENQIPFFVLEILYDIVKPCVMKMNNGKAPESVSSLALNFFKPMLSQNSNIVEHSYPDCKHLLDLLHKSSLLAVSGDTAFTVYDVRDRRSTMALNHAAAANLSPGNQYWGLKYCAEELVQSGIELRKESGDSLVNITTTSDRQLIINIPPLFIDEVRDSLFRNLIAYEQSSIKISHHVTSYVILMKSLVRSPRDVKLLRKKGIISQYWIEDQEYLSCFVSFLDEVFPRDFYFSSLCGQVDAYANKFWFRRKMSALYRTYFSTAWSMTSFIAAICLFILTVLQTYFTINPR